MRLRCVLILLCTCIFIILSLHGKQDRTNILLLGDSTGDPNMIMGFPDARNCIKIGYLNYKVRYLEINKHMFLTSIFLGRGVDGTILGAV